MTHEWCIKKEGKKWILFSRVKLDDDIWHEWSIVGTYKTRRFAVTIGMLMRDRGEKISWPGGALRMGIAVVDPC